MTLTALPIHYGNDDMGDVTDETNRTCRFPIEQDNLVMLYLRGFFTGGSGTANLSIFVDKSAASKIPKTYFKLYTFLAVGTSKHVHGRWLRDERKAWQFQKGDEIVVEWTNPDAGNMSWVIELGLTNA